MDHRRISIDIAVRAKLRCSQLFWSQLPDPTSLCGNSSAAGTVSAASSHRQHVRMLAAMIVLVGVAARIATLTTPHVYFADEIFQYLEAAHRIAFGPGVVPWEYRGHIRSWLVPLALAGPMRLGDAISPVGGAYLLFPKLMLLSISLSTIPAAGAIGRRISTTHALFAMLAAAIGVEFVYFSTVALTEPLGAFLFLGSAALLYRRAQPKVPELLGAGALMALTCVVRFQYGPAMMALAATASIARPRQMMFLIFGGIPALTLSALIDTMMGDVPFGWLFANIHQNITLGRSHAWVDGPFFYLQAMVSVWGICLAPLLGLALVGAWRFPALMLAAVVNIALHSAIAHKEYRYILLTTMLLTILAAVGTADAVCWLRRRSSPGRWTHLPWIAAAGWLAISISTAANAAALGWWTRQQPALAAFATLRERPKLCGVAMYGFDWTWGGGYTYLHRSVPLLAYTTDQRGWLTREAAQFDSVIAPGSLAVPAGFFRERCFAGSGPAMCVSTRPGKCASLTSSAEINRQLIRLDR